jgi:hypothetical protein
MKLTKKQIYDLKQFVKREACFKPSCYKCMLNCDLSRIWHVGGMPRHIMLQPKDIKKANNILKQHFMAEAGKILLGGNDEGL